MGAEDRPSSPPPGGAARQRLAPHRVTWRSRGALILRDVLGALVAGGNDAASQRAVADRLGISHTAMQRLVGDGDPAVALGDVMAMGADIGIPVLEGCIAALRAHARGRRARRDLNNLALASCEATGNLAREVRIARADGHVDLVEVGKIEAAAYASKSEIHHVLAECSAIRRDLGHGDGGAE